MRRAELFVTTAALVVGAANLRAQTPNFAGTWTRIVDASAPAANIAGEPDALTIVQDSNTLTMTQQMTRGSAPGLVFNLDGTDRKTMTRNRDGDQSETVTRAKWDGSTFVETVIRNLNGASVVSATFALSLDASGHLVVVVTRTPLGGGNPVTTTSSFKKS